MEADRDNDRHRGHRWDLAMRRQTRSDGARPDETAHARGALMVPIRRVGARQPCGLPEADTERSCRYFVQEISISVHHVSPVVERGYGDLRTVRRPRRRAGLRADRPTARDGANRCRVSAVRGDQLHAAAARVVRDPRAVRRPGGRPRVADEEPWRGSVEADDRNGVRSARLDGLQRDRVAVGSPTR